jgi:flagellar motor component MotA
LSVVARVTLALTTGPGEQGTTVALVFMAPMMLLGVATGIVSIIAGVKLFGLENDLQHLIRPYAVISIVSGACFATLILAPVGMLLLVAENVILALAFFRAGESEPTVEFV